ncbi:hypothetical protein ACFP81_14015 [Deinococcus lacus]|uniref:PTS EIIA type-4 domain-containing protein n=1 Tax=Deinococcus lacus TaxID=392561 RepID=A0ABW1YF87_9DEIO
MDLGSAYLSSTLATELLPEEAQGRVALAEAPLVEGAFLAALEAALGNELSVVKAAAQEASHLKKMA